MCASLHADLRSVLWYMEYIYWRKVVVYTPAVKQFVLSKYKEIYDAAEVEVVVSLDVMLSSHRPQWERCIHRVPRCVSNILLFIICVINPNVLEICSPRCLRQRTVCDWPFLTTGELTNYRVSMLHRATKLYIVLAMLDWLLYRCNIGLMERPDHSTASHSQEVRKQWQRSSIWLLSKSKQNVHFEL